MSTEALSCIIGGEKRNSSARRVTITNPWDNSAVGVVTLATEADANEAIEKAQAGFRKTRSLASFERAGILSFISEQIQRQREEFARLITAEVGKPIQWSLIEVDRAAMTFQLAAEESKRIGGETLSLDLNATTKNRFGLVRRFPIGVVLCIAPFNYPLNLVAHKVAPAIASGNAFILKPPPQAPLTSLKLADLLLASGFPKEAFSVLPCTNDVAEQLVADERVAMLSFTGSPAVGWHLKAKAGKKKVLLELGGNAGVIIDDTADIDQAVAKNVIGSFLYAGQVCIKVQRIYLHEAIYEGYRDKFVEAVKSVKFGDPSDPQTMMGPLIDDAAAERVSQWIAEAVQQGAKVLAGGERKGRIVAPTVLETVPRTANVFCKEVFGPVVTLHKFNTMEEAVAGINDSRFGLQAGIFSNNFQNIFYAYQNIDVGAVIVNDNPTFRVDNMPYGGIKDSGFGREGLKYAIEAMTEPKLLVADLQSSSFFSPP
jgi:glyceraldehyde-3-phosphate dehydrogenase (NADP+)